MEREYKWNIPQETLAAFAGYLHDAKGRLSHDIMRMAAVYYDTPDGLLHQQGGALRIRRENDRSVCCMKRTVMKEGALALREEYEAEAQTLAEGLQKLPDAGAPRDFCILLMHQEFRELGRTEFTRNCYLVEIHEGNGFTAEFAFDVGELGVSGHMKHFEELELEFKSGDADAFTAYAETIEKRFSLIPQRASKLARAIAAAKESSCDEPKPAPCKF